jgi:hypothetical protein
MALSHDAAVAEQMAAAHPLLRYRTGPGTLGNAALFDGPPPAHVQALGQRMRPSLVDLFVALTRKPELDRTHFGRRTPMDRILPLMQREWLQNRFGWALLGVVPLVLALLLTGFGQVNIDEDTVSKLGDVLPVMLAFGAIGITMLTVFAIVWIASLIIASGLPRRDHGDRSIEFWLSLPVSHSASLAVPMGVHLLLVPAAGLVIGLLGGFAVSLVLVGHYAGVPAWLALPWAQLVPAGLMLLLRLLAGVLLATLWSAPLILLTMLMTAWFRRWGWVAMAALGLGVVLLKRIFGHPLLADLSTALMRQAGRALVSLGDQGYRVESPGDLMSSISLVPAWAVEDLGRALRDLASPLFLGSLLVSAGLFALLVLWRQRGAAAAA